MNHNTSGCILSSNNHIIVPYYPNESVPRTSSSERAGERAAGSSSRVKPGPDAATRIFHIGLNPLSSRPTIHGREFRR
ncbi:hypothetical protein DPEC_G00089510 [Dallia pectoralis]|uniref:Uncharacterized protein n=1 Tax=Dallia pectoralis TaxID=75939 RepID=A0ACC2H0T8_DALPE|nr:hypothetical protein DPEC_G00089510 [Dallia pectoralis]